MSDRRNAQGDFGHRDAQHAPQHEADDHSDFVTRVDRGSLGKVSQQWVIIQRAVQQTSELLDLGSAWNPLNHLHAHQRADEFVRQVDAYHHSHNPNRAAGEHMAAVLSHTHHYYFRDVRDQSEREYVDRLLRARLDAEWAANERLPEHHPWRHGQVPPWSYENLLYRRYGVFMENDPMRTPTSLLGVRG